MSRAAAAARVSREPLHLLSVRRELRCVVCLLDLFVRLVVKTLLSCIFFFMLSLFLFSSHVQRHRSVLWRRLKSCLTRVVHATECTRGGGGGSLPCTVYSVHGRVFPIPVLKAERKNKQINKTAYVFTGDHQLRPWGLSKWTQHTVFSATCIFGYVTRIGETSTSTQHTWK